MLFVAKTRTNHQYLSISTMQTRWWSNDSTLFTFLVCLLNLWAAPIFFVSHSIWTYCWFGILTGKKLDRKYERSMGRIYSLEKSAQLEYNLKSFIESRLKQDEVQQKFPFCLMECLSTELVFVRPQTSYI